MKDFYDVLGVKKDASQDQIKKAYRGKAVNAHPDKGGSQEDMAELSRAYSTLKDPITRIEYDRTGKEPEDTKSLSRDIIMNVFIDVLKLSDEPPNLLAYAVASVNSRIANLLKEKRQVASKFDNLKRKRTRITKKKEGSELNLWQVLIDKQLEAGNGILNEVDKRIKAHEDALKMLEDYEGNDVASFVQYAYTSTMTSTSSY